VEEGPSEESWLNRCNSGIYCPSQKGKITKMKKFKKLATKGQAKKFKSAVKRAHHSITKV
jgi:hypothetical protein